MNVDLNKLQVNVNTTCPLGRVPKKNGCGKNKKRKYLISALSHNSSFQLNAPEDCSTNLSLTNAFPVPSDLTLTISVNWSARSAQIIIRRGERQVDRKRIAFYSVRRAQ